MKKYLFFASIFVFLSLLTVGFASAASGSIWTTKNDCGTQAQDVNQYSVGESVYVNGENFAEGLHNWSIMGLPGSLDSNIVIADGFGVVGSDGSFCFNAYTILADDGGTYKVYFDGKSDNYIVINSDVPLVPEFGLIAGLVALIGGLGVFFYVRRE